MKRDRNEPISELDRIRRRIALVAVSVCTLGLAAVFVGNRYRGAGELLNISYDATREYFAEIDALYSRSTSATKVRTTHAGSVQQAQGVVRGYKADVVTLASAGDLDAIAQTGLVEAGWRARLPHGSSPFTSTIVFLVRAGNPKNVRDWDDLVRPDVRVIVPSPKVSGAGRYAYLAAWAFALERSSGDDTHAERFIASIYAKSPVLDEGARAALMAFLQRDQTDVLLTWENEAWLAFESLARGRVDVVYPPRSIRAEPVVALVDRYAADRGTTNRAEAYLAFLFSADGQEVAARHYLRPRDSAVAARHAGRFREIELFDFSSVFGTWPATVQKHFGPGGTFDRIYNFEQLKRREPGFNADGSRS